MNPKAFGYDKTNPYLPDSILIESLNGRLGICHCCKIPITEKDKHKNFCNKCDANYINDFMNFNPSEMKKCTHYPNEICPESCIELCVRLIPLCPSCGEVGSENCVCDFGLEERQPVSEGK